MFSFPKSSDQVRVETETFIYENLAHNIHISLSSPVAPCPWSSSTSFPLTNQMNMSPMFYSRENIRSSFVHRFIFVELSPAYYWSSQNTPNVSLNSGTYYPAPQGMEEINRIGWEKNITNHSISNVGYIVFYDISFWTFDFLKILLLEILSQLFHQFVRWLYIFYGLGNSFPILHPNTMNFFRFETFDSVEW